MCSSTLSRTSWTSLRCVPARLDYLGTFDALFHSQHALRVRLVMRCH